MPRHATVRLGPGCLVLICTLSLLCGSVTRLLSCTLPAYLPVLVSSVVATRLGARYLPRAVAIPLSANIFFGGGLGHHLGHNQFCNWLPSFCILSSSAPCVHTCGTLHPLLLVRLCQCPSDLWSSHLCHPSCLCHLSLHQGSSMCRSVHHVLHVVFGWCQSACLMLPLSPEAEVLVRRRPCWPLPLPCV